MTREELLARRWGALMPSPSENLSPAAVVARLGAVQAQDYAMAVLAVGLRSTGPTPVEQALDEGSVVRTHVMRPTWHLVAAEDLRWMVALTTQGVTKVGPQYSHRGLTPEILARSQVVIEGTLAQGPQTRAELGAALEANGLATDGQRLVHYLFAAEQDLVVCSGPRRDGAATYDLVDRRVPASAPVGREEALARLALRYITGHGPATDHDFAWWAGLGITEARKGLQACSPRLATDQAGDLRLWFDPDGRLDEYRGFRWLPAFDESLIAFADRTAVLDPVHFDQVSTRNGLFRPFVVHEGRLVGTWKRPKAPNTKVEVTWFDQPPTQAEEAWDQWTDYLARIYS